MSNKRQIKQLEKLLKRLERQAESFSEVPDHLLSDEQIHTLERIEQTEFQLKRLRMPRQFDPGEWDDRDEGREERIARDRKRKRKRRQKWEEDDEDWAA